MVGHVPMLSGSRTAISRSGRKTKITTNHTKHQRVCVCVFAWCVCVCCVLCVVCCVLCVVCCVLCVVCCVCCVLCFVFCVLCFGLFFFCGAFSGFGEPNHFGGLPIDKPNPGSKSILWRVSLVVASHSGFGLGPQKIRAKNPGHVCGT